MDNMDKKSVNLENKAIGKAQLKNDNPNHSHNIKKEALGPNTKR